MSSHRKLSDADAAIQILADFQPSRWLTMLATYIDDSGRGQKPTFVFAGWVARAEHFIAFDKEWQSILDEKPRLAYLKTKHAMALHPGEQFKGWTRKQIDARIDKFMKAIETHYLARVSISVPYKHFETHYLGRIAERMDTPYVFAAYLVMIGAVGSLYEEGCRETVQFVYDTTDWKEQDLITSGWRHMVDTAPPRFRPLLGNPPDFRDDKVVLPLQAADLYAWHLRKAHMLSRRSGRQWEHPIWERLQQSRQVIEHECSATEIANSARMVRAMHDELKLRFRYDDKPKRKQ